MTNNVKFRYLPIKKIYLDQILAGTKTIEYRQNSLWFQKLFASNPTHLILHYFKKEKIIARISKVELVPIPKEYVGLHFLGRGPVFAIHLTDVAPYDEVAKIKV